ncbi:LuxR C-terminal-related transcriptional regulator [Piscinibacter sakaiensis]|uniref:LuxR C-terminal-related transcriptional regulator n=1 Tax=Piscinibacter sakaiensis TaxID=1547922 RepID=UPI003AADC9BC
MTPPLPMALPLTKFRVPRARRDFVRREALLQRLRRMVEQHPVTLIQAPAGSGKTTLMVQLAEACGPAARCIWVALDDNDNDAVRLLATLVQSLGPLELDWAMDPQVLVANVPGSGSEARAVLAAIVNAMCTASLDRIVWLLDDLHRITDASALGLLQALIERLPEHVSLVLGSRVEPAIGLARLRAHGELAEFDAEQLRFDSPSVVELARLRWGIEPTPQLVEATLRRTHGWAVGVNLVLASGADTPRRQRVQTCTLSSKAMFDFLAQEVLDELPPALRRFVIECAILPELSPARCDAVTGGTDSRRVLETLLQRNLFLSVVDEAELVLRFHDLFRDFLLTQLDGEPADYRRALHAKAAAVEEMPDRAIGHWLDAGQWAEAAALMASHGLGLAAAGAYPDLERWIARLPADVVDAEPRLALLRAECAWVRWDWEQVLQHAAPAADGLARQGDQAGRLRAQLLLAAALGALGHLQEREQLTEESLQLPDLPAADAAQFHLQRAWSVFSLGQSELIARHLAVVNDLVAEDPQHHAPLVAQTLNCHFGGIPGVTQAYLRFAELCDTIPKPTALPWHSTPVILGAWAALWQGRRAGVVQELERAAQIQHSFGRVRCVLLDAAHLQALLLALDGDFDAAGAIIGGLLADLESGDAAGLRRVWQRPYRSVLARLAWIALDAPTLAKQASLLAGPLRHREWPLTAAAVATVAGQAALLAGDLDAAQQQLDEAAALQQRFPAPAFYADPRIALAEVFLRRQQRGRAWETLLPVVSEIGRDGTPGRLLLEPKALVDALLATCPATAPEAELVASIQRTLDAWHQAGAGAGDTGAASCPLNPVAARLTEREREVVELVAQGLSNKLLARKLSLSPHTVKRHLANILDKLDCDTRGQAADLWRRHAVAS